MENAEFRHWLKEAADWSADYREQVRDFAVRSGQQPGDSLAKLPPHPPQQAEDFAKIFADFKELIPTGMTHWQHPRFFAYFGANASKPSVIAETLTATIGAQCMLWQTSPLATEMELRMFEWLAQMCDLPKDWHGVIQDTASSATLAATITAREIALDWAGHKHGLSTQPVLRFYTTKHRHSSIDKAIWITGIGADNLVEIPADDSGSMVAEALQEAITQDRQNGLVPAGLFATIGSTSTGTIDNLKVLGKIVRAENLFGHVDAAWAGSAAICPEYRYLIEGLDQFDSYVFNPHKWLGVNLDFSAHFVRDVEKLERSLTTQPDYLKTQHADTMPDLSNRSLQLGRRFRALKLWFVIRSYGIDGLADIVRNHIAWAKTAATKLKEHPDFAIVTGPNLSLFTFRHQPNNLAASELNQHNAKLLDAINAAGFTYLTQTTVNDDYVIRFQVGHTDTTEVDVNNAIDHIIEQAGKLTS